LEAIIHGGNNFIVADKNGCKIDRMTIHSDANIVKNVEIGSLIIFGSNNYFD
jgi:hypothetical protein